MLRKQKCSGLVIDNKGGLKPIKFVGPPNFNMWLSSYNVPANALMLLGAVHADTLDEYRYYHQRFNAEFGDGVLVMQQIQLRSSCWFGGAAFGAYIVSPTVLRNDRAVTVAGVLVMQQIQRRSSCRLAGRLLAHI